MADPQAQSNQEPAKPTVDSTPTNNPKGDNYWKGVEEMGIAALSAAMGDPEAVKTLVDVLANATYKGLEHLDLKDQQKNEIKDHIKTSIDKGADGVISAVSKFQKASQDSNIHLREKYGRNAA